MDVVKLENFLPNHSFLANKQVCQPKPQKVGVDCKKKHVLMILIMTMITIINPIERPSFMMLCQFHQFDEIHQIHQFQQFDKVIRSNEFKFGIWIRLK